MQKQLFFFISGMIVCLSALHGQVTIKQHHFEYKETDAQNCYVRHVDYTYPVFYSEKHNLWALNDSVRKILLIYTLDEKESPLVYLIENGIDTFITNAGPVEKKVECDQPEVFPDEEHLGYKIFINNDQLVSFAITSDYYAGAGHGARTTVYPFCYDLKRNDWINFTSLFPATSDTLLLNKTDSLYLNQTAHEELNEWCYFTGEIGIQKGNFVFYYTNRWYGKYWYEEIVLPFEEYEKYLLPKYRELLNASSQKVPDH